MVGVAWATDEFLVIPIRNFTEGASQTPSLVRRRRSRGLAGHSGASWPAIVRRSSRTAFTTSNTSWRWDCGSGTPSPIPCSCTIRFCQMQKGLGFLGSVYTNEPAWKLMRRKRADEPERPRLRTENGSSMTMLLMDQSTRPNTPSNLALANQTRYMLRITSSI